MEWSIFADKFVGVRPGLPISGRSEVKISVSHGSVDLDPLLANEPEDAPGFIRKTVGKLSLEDTSKVPLRVLCQKLEMAGSKARWLWSQVAHNVACIIESEVLVEYAAVHEAGGVGATPQVAHVEHIDDSSAEETVEDEIGGELFETRQQRSKRSRQENAKKKSKLRVGLAQSASYTKTILMYFKTARKEFSAKRFPAMRVSFCTDASTVGLVDRMLGFFCMPNNICAWAPPVVPVER